MTAKRNRWLVGGVLIVALAAFLSLSLLPLLGSIGNQQSSNPASTPTAGADQRQTQLEQEARGYEAVLAREPDNLTALQGLVETRIQLGDLDGVIDPLERLAELNPDQPEYAVLLGQAQQQLGNLDAAASSYRTVLDQRPGNMQAMQGLVALLVQQDRPQAAIGLLQETLQTAQQLAADGDTSIDTTSVRLLLAEVQVSSGNVDQALTIYDDAIAQAGSDFRPLLAKALVLQSEGRSDEAKPLFAQAEAIAPAQYKDQIQQMAAGEAAQPAPSVPEAGDSPVPDTAPESEAE
ncbi:Tfp pilus assembly protein PilF [filamentous cyanobacterium CCP5]|nr:Tfp pilus assembly protein PilF [filamentous cyanobacterium CCP5]